MPDLKRLRTLARKWTARPRDAVDRQLAVLAQRLLRFHPQQQHDEYTIAAIEQALIAADKGNPAVGAVLVDTNGSLVAGAGPRNLRPHFRSDMHAEMNLITGYEQRNRFRNQQEVMRAMQGMTLHSSLEPCAMCLPRLIMSGVTTVLHAADETGGGMVHKQENLPEVWQQLIAAGNKRFARADCSQELRDISWEAFLCTISASGRTDLWPDAHVNR